MRRTALCLFVAILFACSTGAEEPDQGSLVVTGVHGEVTLVDPESGEREVLTEADGYQGPVQPTASRDGDVVVWTAAAEDGGAIVKVRDAEGVRDIEVPTFPFFYAFDSGSATVAALGNDPEQPTVALLLIDLESGVARIVDDGSPYYVDWHPEDPMLAVHVGIDRLAILDGEGEPREIPVGLGDFQAPAWTSSGEVVVPLRSEGATVALGTVQASIDELAVVDPSDGSHHSLASLDDIVTFDVGGDRVAYVEGPSGPLTVVGLDGSGTVEVTTDEVVAFEWSPDGERLLFHRAAEDSGLVPGVWDGSDVTEYEPYVPSGVFLVEYLPFWSQYIRTITQWAPDGSAFAYADGVADPSIWVQPLDGDRRDIGAGAMVTWAS